VGGAGTYQFMVWVHDGSVDTFRIKVWQQIGGTEVVVYDNTTNQSVGGGNILIHKAK
jgi:hypothetical protein